MDVQPKYEEQFTGYIDFLGFSQASKNCDEAARSKILNLLMALAAQRGEFNIETKAEGTSKTTNIRAAIGTFSDHIVVSYPLAAIRNDAGPGERMTALHVFHHFSQLVTAIAAAALSIGFLIRGGAAIGPLYHSQGVVFGEALIDAYLTESRTSIYPRIVLSGSIIKKQEWVENHGLFLTKDDDGLYHVDYFRLMLHAAVPPGPTFTEKLQDWFNESVSTINMNLRELEREARLNELAKWTWFARRFRASIQSLPQPLLDAWGISIAKVPWTV